MRFRRHLGVEVDGDRVFLIGEDGVTVVSGAAAGTVASSLRAGDVPDPGTAEPEQIRAVLAGLRDAGLLVDASGPTGSDDGFLAFWDALGLDAPTAERAVAGTRVAVVALGALDPAVAQATVRAAGLQVTEDADDHDVTLVLCEDYLDPALAAVDAAARRRGTPILLARPSGTTVWVGPLLHPGGPCWHCLSSRFARHRGAEIAARRAVGADGPLRLPRATTGPATRIGLETAAHVLLLWAVGHRHAGQDRIRVWDTRTMEITDHEVRRRPQCPACGDPGRQAELGRTPVVLGRGAAERPGTLRSTEPEQVWERYRHLVGPVTGVAKEIRRDRAAPSSFHVFRSGGNLAVRPDLRSLRSGLRAQSGGKGLTEPQARVSALGEAVERYSAVFQGDEARVHGRLRDLGGDGIHPNDCMLYDARQYAGRDEWNARHSAFQRVCPPFDPGTPTDWTPLWSLTGGRFRYLPAAYLWFDVPADPASESVLADSNGNAAGSTLEEAVLHGLLELVERDAVALWWYNRSPAPGVELDHGDPWVRDVTSAHAALGREVWALDVTSDLGVPVVVAVSRRRAPGEEILFGFGAHPDRGAATRRALSELNQMMPMVLTDDGRARPVRDGPPPTDDPVLARWLRGATVANQPYLLPDAAAHAAPPDREVPAGGVVDAVEQLRHRIERAGMEVLVLDQTRPDVEMPVVKTVVPGMRHFWPRFAPGRLFDVPVALGRLERPTRFDDLNPVPMFL